MKNLKAIADVLRKLHEAAEYHDGEATVPGYLLEQLFLLTGVQTEHHYTEDTRCEHGMFFSGAGACPKCGRGAE